jgi:predicted nuclease with RNAse H fold
VKYPVFLGIDLTSSEAKPSACVGLDSRSRLVYFGFVAKDKDITSLVSFYSPEVVAIDAPLSFPLGLCCLEEACPCESKSGTKARQCDYELRRLGIPCYPTSKKTFIKELIYRGIRLKTGICRDAKQVGQVIEVYPFASKVRLFGGTVPRKSTRQGMSFHRAKLAEIVPGLKPYLDLFDHDLCDAAMAAHTALLHGQGRGTAIGRSPRGANRHPYLTFGSYSC